MGKFDNACSMTGFIGNYSSVDEIILSDTKELSEIGGSFCSIADKIKDIISYVSVNELKGCHYGKLENPHYNNYIDVLFVGHTKGFQVCPFSGCKKSWSMVIEIQNIKISRILTINDGIEHLVREHNFLEKGNEYGISAKEFYEHFM
ncbi:MAG: hypothetical protein ACP5N1_06370 [Candidatus Woesearchaeota archaeon]